MGRGSHTPDLRARLAVGVGVAAISLAAIFFREAAPIHPLVAAAGRLGLAAALLSPFVLRHWDRLPVATRRDAALGGLFYALHFGTWVTSLNETSVAASVTLVTATPILLAGWGLVTRRDPPGRRQLWAIGLAFVGVGLIGWRDLSSEGALVGDLLAFAGAAAMAGYLVVARRQPPTLHVGAYTGIACAVGALLLLVAALGLGVPLEIPSVRSGVFVALAALVPQLVGHSALTWSLRHLSPTAVGLATVAEPVGSTLLAWCWLGETPAALTLLGCAITLSAVVFSLGGAGGQSGPTQSRVATS